MPHDSLFQLWVQFLITYWYPVGPSKASGYAKGGNGVWWLGK